MVNTSSESIDNQYKTLSNILSLINKNPGIEQALKGICNLLPEAYPSKKDVSVKIQFENDTFYNEDFIETQWLTRKNFRIPGGKNGSIEVYYSREYIGRSFDNKVVNEDVFISQVLAVITGAISKYQLDRLIYDNSERLKELKSIHRTAETLKKGASLDESLQEICNYLPEAWQYPNFTAVRIKYGNKTFRTKRFKETPWMLTQIFEAPDNNNGSIEIAYLKAFPNAWEGPFLKEERDLLDNLAALISGTASANALKELLKKNTERLKEIKGINQTSLILDQGSSFEESLQLVCSILPQAWQYPEDTVVRIEFDDKIYQSDNFQETIWTQKQEFKTPGRKKGVIEIFYLKEFPTADEGPFLKEERDLLINLSHLIEGSATKNVFNKLLNENRERLKELRAINQTSRIIEQGRPVEETLLKICQSLPKSWQYPRHTAARITYEEKVYTTKKFRETQWIQTENFVTIDNKKGTIEIFYLKEFPARYEGPFLKEERNLLINISRLVCGYLNNYKGREYYRKNIIKEEQSKKNEEYKRSLVKNKQPLQLFFNKQTIDKYIYLDMMKFKVKEILFVSTLYDAFILENEDRFFEQFMGEIYQYSLFSLPRITCATSHDQTLELIDTASFDLVILMIGIDRDGPVAMSREIKKKKSDLPVYFLVNRKSNINYLEELIPSIPSIDKLFLWSGDSQIFFAIVKSLEDKVNVDNDTRIGLVRIILLVEDSVQYYSKYLQMIYSIVFGQIQQILPEVEKNEIDKIVKMRSRPKVLLARNYEDAVYIFNKYKDYLLCVISDVEFEKEGRLDKSAGIKFINYVKSHILNLPVVLQSSEDKNAALADKYDVCFINKNSETLLNDLKQFLTYYLGFGDFIFRNKEGKEIAVAKSMAEFEKLLETISDESFYLHASENQFSLWFMSRGEIPLAKALNPLRMSDFENISKAKQYFIRTIRNYREEKRRGKVLNYDKTLMPDEKNIFTFSGGSLGGKGRGLAFINTFVNNMNFSPVSEKINIRSPITIIIGTDEFEAFIENNNLYETIIRSNISYQKLRNRFTSGQLSESLIEKLRGFISSIKNPIAVRSSSLSEDSFTQPFAGVFDTYIVPNQYADQQDVLRNLETAIKLVYASIYSDSARTYFRAIGHKIEEEKMAVVLQELIGSRHDNYYYPHISGIAQSYNFYPVSHMKPEEGFAVAAVGLGVYVVNGRKAYRFSPKYPNVEIFTTKDLINSTQVEFYAVDLDKKDIDFEKDGELASLSLLDISEAEQHGTLKHCASVYDPLNDRINSGLRTHGPRIVNFAHILKYDYCPLAETIDMMLHSIQEALGSPVEIEYAVDLNKTENNLPSFYLLQIKPLTHYQLTYNVDLEKLDKKDMILFTHSSLGNGEINTIRDVIFIDTLKFNKHKTMEMVSEIESLNKLMMKENRQYVLIGPGRWGSRDPFLGVPVSWSQISNAKIIVEISLANYPLDSSLGSHFFHNITSMNIGYFAVQDSSKNDFIRWKILDKQKVLNHTTFFKHVRFSKPLAIKMNGKQRLAVIEHSI